MVYVGTLQPICGWIAGSLRRSAATSIYTSQPVAVPTSSITRAGVFHDDVLLHMQAMKAAGQWEMLSMRHPVLVRHEEGDRVCRQPANGLQTSPKRAVACTLW
jgi:hypothetical protein